MSSLFTIEQPASFASSVTINNPYKIPKASGFLWNQCMMAQINCKGYVSAQFMQPNAAKYSVAPVLEASTFMQPEQPLYQEHPGRFFYVKFADGELISLPFEPCKTQFQQFEFTVEDAQIRWRIKYRDVEFNLTVALIDNQPCEFWQLEIHAQQAQSITLIPMFSIGYRSWMYQQAEYDQQLDGIVARAITPYQKLEDYPKIKTHKELCFLVASEQSYSWCANTEAFIGLGSWQAPSCLTESTLPNKAARYENAIAALAYDIDLTATKSKPLAWLFGAAKTTDEIWALKQELLVQPSTETNIATPSKALELEQFFSMNSELAEFDDFASHWLPRQCGYLSDLNRLTTDPQTRNYLQDNLATTYFFKQKAKSALVRVLTQQYQSGALPDGILLNEQASLNYINQVPHADHCVWLIFSFQHYLAETGDIEFLQQSLPFADDQKEVPVFVHIEAALNYLLSQLDERQLSLIKQGDWCDPMNMAGAQGKGVSAWLSMALVWALKVWCKIVARTNINVDIAKIDKYQNAISEISQAINHYFWCETWYARGISDNGQRFGQPQDEEGQIYLNSQSWAMLAEIASPEQQAALIASVETKLNTPYGLMMLAPSYTKMQEHIGRLTQKYPGTAENGSVYNHAIAFYIYALYQSNQADLAFEHLQKMLPSNQDAHQRQQLPVFVPNYFRGAWELYPDYAGRSSQLINTGTVPWLLRIVVEELCGLKGDFDGLLIQPKLPKAISKITGFRRFQNAHIAFVIEKSTEKRHQMWLDGNKVPSNRIRVTPGLTHQLKVLVPEGKL